MSMVSFIYSFIKDSNNGVHPGRCNEGNNGRKHEKEPAIYVGKSKNCGKMLDGAMKQGRQVLLANKITIPSDKC